MPVLEMFGPSRGHPFMPSASAPGELSAAARRYGVKPMPALEWNAQVERETAHLYERVRAVVPSIEWPFFAPYVKAINNLKKERGAVILAHNYQTPEIYNCSLASSITGEDVRLLRDKFPGVPIVAYVNTSADVKAEVDICCTSGNAIQVVESLGSDTVIFLPDQYLANYVASQTGVKIIAWKGACEVHERFTADELEAYRAADPSVQIIAHPECPPDVIGAADYTGSTKGMIDWVRKNKPKRVVMVTECSMADNVKAELPDVEFVKPCNLCPHMKRITLPKILDSLVYLKEEVTIDPMIADRARRSVERMIHLKS